MDMERKRGKTSTEEFEKAAAERGGAEYILRLYVTGMTPKSTRTIANVQKLCEKHLTGRYELDVIDIYQQLKLAKGEQIIATPTLIKKTPPANTEAHRRHVGYGKVSCRHRSETQEFMRTNQWTNRTEHASNFWMS
jgi:circadian clock protein KaiB